MSMGSLFRILAVSAGTGISTFLYNKVAEKGMLGQSAPYTHPPEAAGLTVGIATLFARATWKNPSVAAGVALTTFTGLIVYGNHQITERKRQWALYDKQGVIPDKQTLELELQRSDSTDLRKRQARELLGVLIMKSHVIRY